MPIKQELLSVWVIYDNPTDYPGFFVARRHEVLDGVNKPTEDHYINSNLETLRGWITKDRPHLMRLPRDSRDEEHIVESWL